MSILFGEASFSSVINSEVNSVIVGSAPPGTQEGELMLAQLVGQDASATGTSSAPIGWEVIAENNSSDGRYSTRQLIAWKIYTGLEEEGDFTFSTTAHGNDDILIIRRVYGGVNYSDPIGTFSAINSGNTANRISPSINVSDSDRTVVFFSSAQHGGSNNPDNTGEPTGTVMLHNVRTRALSAAVRAASAYQVFPSSGSTGEKEWSEFTSQPRYGADATVSINGDAGPAPDPDPEIDPTGTNTTLVNGSSHQISFTGLTATPASVSLVHDGNVFEQPNFSIGAATEGVATANFTAAIGNLPYTSATYPASGFSYLVTNDNGTELTLSGITINPSADRSIVTAVNPVNDSTSIIPSWLEGGAVTGDQIDCPKVVGNIQPTVNADFTHSGARIDGNIPWPGSITFTINYWDSITRIRYAVTVEVAYEEDGTGTVIGITTRELTTRSLTVRNLTMRSL